MPLSNLNAILITNNKLDLSYSSNTTIQSCIEKWCFLSSEHMDNISLKLRFRVKITKKDLTMLLRLSCQFFLM
jgi:hypothetical protein